jgi:hypothetical protein
MRRVSRQAKCRKLLITVTVLALCDYPVPLKPDAEDACVSGATSFPESVESESIGTNRFDNRA